MSGRLPRRLFRLAVHVVAGAAVLLLLTLPRSRYAWVSEVDPGFDPAEFQDQSGNRIVAIAALVILIMLLEGIALSTARGHRERAVPILLMLCAIATWLIRFS